MPIIRRTPRIHQDVNTSPLDQDVTISMFGARSVGRAEIESVNIENDTPITTIVGVTGRSSRGRVGTPNVVINPGSASPVFSCDCSSFSSDSLLHAVMGTTTQNNVHAEFGVGMRYDFIPKPNQCNDQALVSRKFFQPSQEVWIQWRGRFSTNWTTVNPNCSSPAPAYKWVLTHLQNDTNCGSNRFDWVCGLGGNGQAWATNGPGAPQCDNAPISVVQPGQFGSPNPYRMDDLADGQWHTIQLHFKIEIGPERTTIQGKVDNTIIANYRTTFSSTIGLAGNAINQIKFGANRNLGNPLSVNMNVWWDDINVWTSDPGHMSWPTPTDY